MHHFLMQLFFFAHHHSSLRLLFNTCCIFRSSVGIQVHCVSDLLFYVSGSVCRMHNASFFFLSLDGGVLLFSWWLRNIAYAALFDLHFFITCDFVSFLWVELVSVILANTLRSNFKRKLCDLRYWGRSIFLTVGTNIGCAPCAPSSTTPALDGLIFIFKNFFLYFRLTNITIRPFGASSLWERIIARIRYALPY